MSWLIAGLAFLLVAGFAKLSTVALNRSLSVPQPKRLLVTLQLIQLSSMPLYALLLLVVLFEKGLWLRDRPCYELSFMGVIVIASGLIGFLLLFGSTMRFQCYRPPACEIANNSVRLDFRKMTDGQTWQEKFVGEGPMRRLALLPGNEQFSLEVSTKTYSLPRLPQEWDGLSIVLLADTHFLGAVSRAYYEAVCEQAMDLKPDMFVFTGDLLDNAELVDWLPHTFGRLKSRLGQYFILGNHDMYRGADQIRVGFEQQGWKDLSSRSVELTSPNVNSAPSLILAGDETPWMGTHPDLGQVPHDSFRILLSHTPDNIEWAKTNQVDLMLSGHTHGGQIRLPVLGPIYAPSRYSCRFASGVFWMEPTLLYVSRGISGREPIRYNCVPELTKLVITRA